MLIHSETFRLVRSLLTFDTSSPERVTGPLIPVY